MLTEKQLRDTELVKFHKSLVTNHLKYNLSWNSKRVRIISNVYDSEINQTNIRRFINRPLDIFIKALITGQLDKISDYIQTHRQDTEE